MVGELLGLLPLVVGQGQVKVTGKRAPESMRRKYIARSMPIENTNSEQSSSTYMTMPPFWKNVIPVVKSSIMISFYTFLYDSGQILRICLLSLTAVTAVRRASL